MFHLLNQQLLRSFLSALRLAWTISHHILQYLSSAHLKVECAVKWHVPGAARSELGWMVGVLVRQLLSRGSVQQAALARVKSKIRGATEGGQKWGRRREGARRSAFFRWVFFLKVSHKTTYEPTFFLVYIIKMSIVDEIFSQETLCSISFFFSFGGSIFLCYTRNLTKKELVWILTLLNKIYLTHDYSGNLC